MMKSIAMMMVQLVQFPLYEFIYCIYTDKVITEHRIFKNAYANEGVLLTRPDQQAAWDLYEPRHAWSWSKKQGAARRSSVMSFDEAEREVVENIIPSIKVYRNVEYNFNKLFIFREPEEEVIKLEKIWKIS